MPINPTCYDCLHSVKAVLGVNCKSIINYCRYYLQPCERLYGFKDGSRCYGFDLCYNPETPFCKSLNVSNIQEFTDKILNLKNETK